MNADANQKIHALIAGRYPCTLELMTHRDAAIWSTAIAGAEVDITKLVVNVDAEIHGEDVPLHVKLTYADGASDVLR